MLVCLQRTIFVTKLWILHSCSNNVQENVHWQVAYIFPGDIFVYSWGFRDIEYYDHYIICFSKYSKNNMFIKLYICKA